MDKAGVFMFFRYQLKKSILSKEMLLALSIAFVCLFIGGYDPLFLYSDTDFAYIFFNSVCTGTSCILALIYPMVATLPYAASYSEAKRTGYINYEYMKVSKCKYVVTKILTVGISGGIAIAIPVFFILVLSLICKGSSIDNSTIISYITHGEELFIQSPICYCLLYVVNSFICGFIFAVLGLTISTYTTSRFLVNIIPFGIFIFGAMFLANININLNPINLLDINSYYESNFLFSNVYKIIILVVESLIIWKRVDYYEE